jgi:NAD(P)-dependent dehydrogenase (short-subunit alcohol dehydrogenase family)
MDLDLRALFGLDGRVAIVTGASSGLGDRFARVLHAAGAQVVGVARRGDRLDALAIELGERFVGLPADVADPDATASVVDEAVRRFGRIDVLVNNAGVGTVSPAEEESLDDFRHTVDVNLVGLFAITQAVARHMLRARSGSIVNVASILGLVASAPIEQAGYCATKGAVVSLTRELAAQWARERVRVNALAPGWFPTEMTSAEMFEKDSGRNFISRNCPMGRGGELAELDGALLYLASDASSYVCGQTLVVDGGWTIR